MKRLWFIATLCLFMFGCGDKLYDFEVWNKSCYPIIVVPEQFDGLEATYNPKHAKHPGSSYQTAFPGENVIIHSWNKWEVLPSLQDSGYIKIYVLDTLNLRDTIQIYYMEEWSAKQSCSKIFFPPTESMSTFRMWPPYGTYDAHGNKVEQ